MAGDLAVALARVHVAHVEAGAGHLDRRNEDRARAHRVDVHVAVGLVLRELLGRQRVVVRRADEEGAEVAGVVAVGHRLRRAGAELAEEGTHPHQRPRHVRRRIGQDRMLAALFGKRRVMVGVTGDRLGGGLGQGQAYLSRLVEGDGVAVDDLERFHRIAALVAADGVLADPLDVGGGPDGVAGGTAGGDIGVAEAESLGRAVVARRRGDLRSR